MFLARPGDAQQWRAKGASLFLLQSDHDFLRSGAEALAATIRAS
jgi:2-keto-3-deoxy-L-rhamnonate aldolase RhmA